jgi:CRISP-associated protein Cas1
MTDRILDFSQSPARLSVRRRQLTIRRDDPPETTVPLEDISVLIVSHPQVTFTQSVISGLAESGGVFIACNKARLPVSMSLPLTGHSIQTERFALQASSPAPLKKRVWRQIVRAKIIAQAEQLEDIYGTDHGLRALVPIVKSGDPSNVEARAARRYWSRLFDETEFRRDPDRQDENLLLNYGYAVLRAIVARAVCSAGLHPTIGVFHHSRYDAYCLADDLMEPFRPTVDRAVLDYATTHDDIYGVEPEAKRFLIERLTDRFSMDGGQRTIFDVAARIAASLAQVYEGKRRLLKLPEAWRYAKN